MMTNGLGAPHRSYSAIVVAILVLCALVACDDFDCRANATCTEQGRCVNSGEGCSARFAEDCRSSLKCRTDGICGLDASLPGQCFAVSEVDCMTSSHCKAGGRCFLTNDSCHTSDTYGGVPEAHCFSQLDCPEGNVCLLEHCAPAEPKACNGDTCGDGSKCNFDPGFVCRGCSSPNVCIPAAACKNLGLRCY
jgi:hypothetical protein